MIVATLSKSEAEVAQFYTYIDADVSGYDNKGVATTDKNYVQNKKIGDIADSYDFFRYGVKADINDTFSVGILYDEPFGAAAEYSGVNNFVTIGDREALIRSILEPTLGVGNAPTEREIDGTIPLLQANINKGLVSPSNPNGLTPTQLQTAQGQLIGLQAAKALAETAGQGTNVDVRSESITAIVGAKFGANKNFQVYGGPVAQRLKADLDIRGAAYGPVSGYSTHISPDQDYGWLAGISYSKPEIALQAALTYRSEIDHSLKLSETLPLASAASGGALPISRAGILELTTPKSVNFDFQTGINPTTLATAKVRWVPWGDFSITPPLFNDFTKISTKDDKGLPIVEYSDDAWVVELGLAKRLSPALAVSGNVGWDSGAGNPATSLGPVEGYYSVGLGAKYNVTPNWAVSAGGKYLWFGDAKGQISSKPIVSNFEDNNGYILGVKLSYQAKQKFN